VKPLPPAPLTETDEEIWSSVGWMYEKSGVHVWGACFEISLESDRRDAKLMLFAQRCPDACCYSVAVGQGTMVRCCQRIWQPPSSYCLCGAPKP
jgi:hypothetical protein